MHNRAVLFPPDYFRMMQGSYMAQNDPNTLFQELIHQAPDHVLEFVRQTWPIDEPPPETLKSANWWLGIAQDAAAKTFFHKLHPKPHEINLTWARVAVEIYERLSKHSSHHSPAYSMMLFKARLISSEIPELDRSLANVDEIVAWFYDNLPLTIDEAKSLLPLKMAQTKELASEEEGRKYLLSLFNMRDRLEVLALLRERGHLQPNEELDNWINLVEQIRVE
jgi:hypothetical protein